MHMTQYTCHFCKSRKLISSNTFTVDMVFCQDCRTIYFRDRTGRCQKSLYGHSLFDVLTGSVLPDLRGSTDDEAVRQYLESLESVEEITRDQEMTLVDRIQDGDTGAWKRLVLSYLPMVVSIARECETECMRTEWTFWDMIQVGNTGLLLALKKYKAELGLPLCEYVRSWVSQSIRKLLKGEHRGKLKELEDRNKARTMEG